MVLLRTSKVRLEKYPYSRYYYQIEACREGEEWQQFTGTIHKNKKMKIKEFVNHCQEHFRGLGYRFRVVEMVCCVLGVSQRKLVSRKVTVLNVGV